MTRESYQRDLARLIDQTLEMGNKVHASFNMALKSIHDGDKVLARLLDEQDDDIDNQYLRIEDHCLDLIALQQPVASDLRLIASVFKIGTDLERIADLSVNIAEYCSDSDTFILIERMELIHLGELVGMLIGQSLDAFKAEDIQAAKHVIEQDKDIDEACLELEERALRGLIKSEADTHSASEAEQIAKNAHSIFRAIRDLERIGDHAGNVCARLIYWKEADSQYI